MENTFAGEILQLTFWNISMDQPTATSFPLL